MPSLKKDALFRDMVRIAVDSETIKRWNELWKPLIQEHGKNAEAAVEEIYEEKDGKYKDIWTAYRVEDLTNTARQPIGKAISIAKTVPVDEPPSEDPLAQRFERERLARFFNVDADKFMEVLGMEPEVGVIAKKLDDNQREQIRKILAEADSPGAAIERIQDILEKEKLKIAYLDMVKNFDEIEQRISNLPAASAKTARDEMMIKRVIYAYLNDLDRRA